MLLLFQVPFTDFNERFFTNFESSHLKVVMPFMHGKVSNLAMPKCSDSLKFQQHVHLKWQCRNLSSMTPLIESWFRNGYEFNLIMLAYGKLAALAAY